MTNKRFKTLADWCDGFLKSGEVSQNQHANVKSTFKKMAKLLAETSDCDGINIQEAKGLQQIWASHLQKKLADGEIAKNTVRQYRMWANKSITWALSNKHLFAKEAQVEQLNQLNRKMWRRVDYLRAQDKYEERLAVERLFKFISTKEQDFDDFTQNAHLTLTGFEHNLIQSGVKPKTWKSTYRDAIRGLKILQKAGLCPNMPLRPHTSTRIKPYRMAYADFPNQQLKQAAKRYDQYASKPPVLNDDTWIHPPISDRTKKNNLNAVGQYIGFLENINATNTSELSLDEIFSTERLEAFANFYRKNQGNTKNDITEGLKSIIKRIKSVAIHTLDFFSKSQRSKRFDLIYQKRPVISKRPKELRIRSLGQWRNILEEIIDLHNQAKSKHHKVCFRRLYTYLLVLLSAPVRPGNMRKLILGESLIQDPITKKWYVHLAPQYVKTRKPYRIPLPPFVTEVLEDYLQHVRPKILKGMTSHYVFPSFEGGPVSDSVILRELQHVDRQVHNVSQEEAVYLHTVRHTTTITCARKLGHQALHSVSKLLGHASLETTLKFYAQNARSLADADRQAERILGKENLCKKDIEILLAMLAKEPTEMKRFTNAFQAQCQSTEKENKSPPKTKRSTHARDINEQKNRAPGVTAPEALNKNSQCESIPATKIWK